MNFKGLIIPFLMLLSAASALAAEGDAAAAGVGIALILIFLVVGVAALAFWVWMLVDVIKRDMNNKVLWILLMVFLGVIGSIVYYFVVKRKG